MSYYFFINSKISIEKLVEDRVLKKSELIKDRWWITDRYGHAFLTDVNKDGHINYLKRFGDNEPIYILYSLVNQYGSEVLGQYLYMELVNDAIDNQPKSSIYYLNKDDCETYTEIETAGILENGSKLDFDSFYHELREERKQEKVIQEQNINHNSCDGNEGSAIDYDDLPF